MDNRRVGAPGDARRFAAVLAAVGVAYALGAEVAWGLFGASEGLAFFPPAGVTFAALVLLPRRRWPLVLALVFVVEVVVDARHGLGWPAFGYALANVVEPVVGAIVLRRATAHPVAGLARRRGFLLFLTAGVFVGPMVGALIGATTRSLDSSSDWPSNVLHWVVGDGIGVLAIGGPILAASDATVRRRLRGSWEAALLVVVTWALSLVVFVWVDQPLVIAVLPVLLWAALRFDLAGVAVVTPLVAVIANLATARGDGPFAAVPSVTLQTRLGLTQVFLAVVVLTAWFFAIETRERIWAQDARRREIEARRVAERDQASGELAARLAHASTTSEIVDVITAHLRARKGADNVVLMVTDGSESAASLVPFASGGIAPAVSRQIAASAVQGDLPARAALRESTPVWLADRREMLERFPVLSDIPDAAAIEALAAVPVEIGASRRACLVLTWATERASDEWDRSQVLAAARLTGQAIERARLFEAEQRAVTRVRALQRLTARLADVATVDEAHAVLVGEVTSSIARGVVLARVTGDQPMTVVGIAGYPDGSSAALSAPSPITAALAGGEPVSVDTPAQMAHEFPRWAAIATAAGDRRLLAVPFAVRDSAATYVLVLGLGAPAPLEDHHAERAFHLALGAQCAQAIERASLRHAEHDAVVHLQQSLLSHSPDTPESVATVARYRPSTRPFDVGGDWHDVVTLADGRCVLVVGDVVGSGLPAAITMAQLRATTRALALHGTPAEILQELDRYAATLSDALCTTVACVAIDAPGRCLRYSTAGHVFPMLRRTDGEVLLLDGGAGLPLGVATRPRPEATLAVAAGDLVVLYTDGLIERRDESIDAGLARLAAALATIDPDDPSWSDHLVAACLEDRDQRDDIALLAARIR